MAQKFLTDIEVTRGLVDSSGDLGVAGQVLSSTGTGTNWITNEASSTVVYQDGFTGDNSTVDFTLSVSVTDENVTQVYIDGVYQTKDTYSIAQDTLTFSTAPPLSADIEVITFATVATSDELQAGVMIIPVKNTHTASIAKGEPVYITGNVGSSARLQIAPADASNSAKMPAAGLLLQTLAVNAEGYVVTGGYLRNLTTDTIDGTSTTSNDTVYVKSGGGLTMTKPTGSNLIQNIAKVARVASGSAGSLIVSSILRTNDVPNITNDYFWLGNSSGVATPTEFTSTGRGLLSVGAEGTASGDGNLAYNNSSGVFTYTPPVLGGLSGTTDDITEGSTNLYYTDARVGSYLTTNNYVTASSTHTLTNKSGNISQWTNDSGYITDGNTNWNNSYGFITASSTETLTNKSGNISMFTNDSGYITDGNTNWNNSYGFITASSTDTLTNKSGNISQWTNDSGYITSFDITTQTDSKYIRSDADDTFTGQLFNGSRNETPGVSAGVVRIQPSTNGGNTGLIFQSKVNSTSDFGYIWWYDDNNNYRTSDSTENGLLLIGVQNDAGNATSQDTVAIESSGNIFLNPGIQTSIGGAASWNSTYGNAYIGNGSTYYRILTTADEGSGNGLDADTVDGQHASAFASSSHTHSASDITSGNLAAARNTANLVDVGGSSNAQGIYFRSANEVISGEPWCTARYAYNENDGFLFLNRNSSSTAFPTFHIGGWNNAGYISGYSNGDGLLTLTRSDGAKSASSSYAGTGLSNTSYYTNIIKTTAKTVFRDAQGLHEFTGNVSVNGLTVGGNTVYGFSGSWNGSNFPGSRWGGYTVNGGEIVFQRDNPSTGKMSVMVDGSFYAGENGGFWSIWSGNNYNNRVGIYGDSGGNLNIGTSATENILRTNYGYIQMGPMNSSHAHIYTDRSNFYFNKQIQLLGGSLINQNDIRSGAFYEKTNTNYFIDPSLNSTIYNLQLGRSGNTPKFDMLFNDHASGAGWDTRIFIGRSDDLPNGNSFPTYTPTGGYGIQFQANSDGVFYGMRQYSSGNYRPFINWGDDGSDTPMEIAFNGTTKFTLSYDGINYATSSHRAPIFYDSNNTGYYGDFASTSVLNGLQFNFTQHGSANNIRMGNSTTMNAISSGTNNAAFGVEALGNCSTGSRNFAYGYAALASLSSGSNNIAMGDATGYNVTSGSNNLLFGHNAGRTGYQSPQSIAGVTTGSNQIHMGNESHTTARIQISWTVNSDARDKTDITPIDVGLDFVNQLNPVTFRWDKRSDYEDRTPTGENKLEELTLGFLAQEVETVEKSYGYDVATKTNLVVDRDVEQDHFGITYEKMIPILTKAIQELTQEVQTLKDQINGIN